MVYKELVSKKYFGSQKRGKEDGDSGLDKQESDELKMTDIIARLLYRRHGHLLQCNLLFHNRKENRHIEVDERFRSIPYCSSAGIREPGG
jgi:hypothetical protein